MTVREMMKVLAECDPDATVYFTQGPSWPLEHAVAGVIEREVVHAWTGERYYAEGTAPRDVLLVEGAWRRYGERAAWDAISKSRR